jgi:outer membrane protein OmpA-like peptidoglycan-associated protein
MNRFGIFCIIIALIGVLATGCGSLTKTSKGTAIGAGAGSVVGAFIGKSAGNTALGAIIGGAIGGTAGAFIGKSMDKQAKELKKTVPDASVARKGEGIIINFNSGILFDADKADLKPNAQTNLQSLATSLQKNTQSNVLITGYTDNTGTAEHNLELSKQRALAVRSFMITNKVDSTRLTAQGMGEQHPIANNNTDKGRAINRRVEIAITAN